jgi:hypothetical protein
VILADGKGHDGFLAGSGSGIDDSQLEAFAAEDSFEGTAETGGAAVRCAQRADGDVDLADGCFIFVATRLSGRDDPFRDAGYPPRVF